MNHSEIEYQLEFIKNCDVFRIILYRSETIFKDSLNKLNSYIELNKPKKLLILNSYEITEYSDRIESIRQLMNSYDIEYYISLATSTSIDNCLHPLVNICFWSDVSTRKSIKWKITNNNSFKLFDISNFENILNKSVRGIFSMRKELTKRNHIEGELQKIGKFDGIYRYIKYPRNYNKEFNDDEISKYPTFFELINEYKSSYISFIVESDVQEQFMNPLTEKTLISFLTKTMPIVLGGANYVKELKEMGFYVWNDEFGFDDYSDSLYRFKIEKIKKFVGCIDYFNKMSKKDIDNMYIDNIEKIESNYNLVKRFLTYNKTKMI